MCCPHPHPRAGSGYQLGPRKGKGVRKFCSLAEGTFWEEVTGTPRSPYSSYSTSSPGAHPRHEGPPPQPPDCPSISRRPTASAGRREPKAVRDAATSCSGRNPQVSERAKQAISGLVSPGTVGITSATHANCPPRVATRLFVSPARTAQHGRTRSGRGRLASA